jgi:hypothetical protein
MDHRKELLAMSDGEERLQRICNQLQRLQDLHDSLEGTIVDDESKAEYLVPALKHLREVERDWLPAAIKSEDMTQVSTALQIVELQLQIAHQKLRYARDMVLKNRTDLHAAY